MNRSCYNINKFEFYKLRKCYIFVAHKFIYGVVTVINSIIVIMYIFIYGVVVYLPVFNFLQNIEQGSCLINY